MKTTILDMPFHAALEIMKEWVKEEHDGKLKLDDPLQCPVQKWIEYNDKGCGKDMLLGLRRALYVVGMYVLSAEITIAHPSAE